LSWEAAAAAAAATTDGDGDIIILDVIMLFAIFFHIFRWILYPARLQ